MKKLILILLVVLNTSFIEPPKLWLGRAFVTMPTEIMSVVKIIKAKDEKTADKIFKKFIKQTPELKGGKIQEPNNPLKYLILEIKPEDILK